ncbi:hypothetical protein LTR53_008582 [Teratosphaeriaceae sp. CCFEE 6253]|nr:hypothetical protein LTR53_008582 [Teratosphaeriaceae sp. CCFEE 6253]
MAAYRPPSPPYAGDDILPTAVMVYDQTRLMRATRLEIWPWIVQLGKGRGGCRAIDSIWLDIKPGDRVDDYGFSVEDCFDVVAVEPEQHLIYRSERYGAIFTWTLMLHESSPDADGAARTLVHLRFRGKIAATGMWQRILVHGGHFMDSMFSWPMLAGLAERVEKEHIR